MGVVFASSTQMLTADVAGDHHAVVTIRTTAAMSAGILDITREAVEGSRSLAAAGTLLFCVVFGFYFHSILLSEN